MPTQEVIIHASIENIFAASGPTNVTVSHRAGRGQNIGVDSEICPWGEVAISRGRPRLLRPARLFENEGRASGLKTSPSVAPLASNLIKFPIEIVSAEVKIDPLAPVVAFGQAVAYRLFSTKTYIAMPTTLTEEDQSRLESLCMLFGVGLVLFDLNKDVPQFSIRVRAQRFSPA
jgi:hypothetical protein